MTTSKATPFTAAPETGRGSPFAILFNGIFSAMALGHFSVDLLNGTRATLLTYLSIPLGLNNTTLAAISTGYVWASAATQPLFGWLTDRLGTRWLASLGILWMFTFFALALFIPGPLGLAFLIIASLGSAAFHPPGATESTLVGREQYAGRETTATSFFFFFGQLGLSLGPVISGPLLDTLGVFGLLAMVSILLPIGLNAGWQLRHRHAPRPTLQKAQARPGLSRASLGAILTLALIGGLQAWAQQNMITFVPKYIADLGQSPTIYGLVGGLFMGGSAFGNVLGGNLADRYGKRRIMILALTLAAIPLFTIAQIGWSPWLYLLIPLSGALTGAVHSIVVVLAQRILPMGMATASGLTLGFIFSAGALGTLLFGGVADAFGWPLIFMLTAAITLTAAALVLLMKEG